MTTTATVQLGPADHGRRMSLAEFENIPTKEGYRYELERRVIIVSDVPNPPHAAQVNALRRQLMAYDLAHPGRIYAVPSGSECKILIEEDESERHPDLAVYTTPPPDDTSDVWGIWVPEIVVEVVSDDSRERDYNLKRGDYLAFGVREYWVVDAGRDQVLVLRRIKGRWVEQPVRPPEVYPVRLLRGLELNVAAVFEAAHAVTR